jgi:restriction system protein
MKYRIKKGDETAIGYVLLGILLIYLFYNAYKYIRSLNTAFQILILILLTTAISVLIYYHIKNKIDQKKLNEAKFRAIKLSNIDNMSGQDFEYYVAKLMRSRGYSVQVTKGSGDLGVDLIVQSGITKYAVQTKRYDKKVPRTAVSDAVAGMKIYDCNIAMVITNNYFQKGAIDLAKVNNCILVDRNVLTEWIYENQNKEV